MVLPENLDVAVNQLLARRRHDEKDALVLPVFEIKTNISTDYPKDKSSLEALWNRGIARQYHGDYYQPNQGPINFLRWIAHHADESAELDVAYTIPDFRPFFEPIFIIASEHFIKFPEIFEGYGMTRSTQVRSKRCNFPSVDLLCFVHN